MNNFDSIKSVAVIGSGVMGAGIAAHIANAGVRVLLLDMPQKGIGKKNLLAKNAIDLLKKSNPAALMSKKNADLITPGNFDDDLKKISEVDWVIEVVIENLDIKQGLYKKIEQYRKENTVVSSNTSTIPLGKLIEGRSDSFKQHFLVTHFFNPPRYMRLLELVKGDSTLDTVITKITDFCDYKLGKGVVHCKDSPGFIANRIGIYWLQTALLQALQHKMSVEEVDKIFNRPMGMPKTGVFGLIDLVGVDLLPLIGKSMKESLSKDDSYVQNYHEPELISKMIADGYTGRKGKGGFYRLNKTDNKKVKEAINLQTGEYSIANKSVFLECIAEGKQGLNHLLDCQDNGGQYAWAVLSELLVYVANITADIADGIPAIDEAMKLGYNWKYGPFELLDKLGLDWFTAKLTAEKRKVPSLLQDNKGNKFYKVIDGVRHYLGKAGKYHAVPMRPDVLLLRDIKSQSQPIVKNASASLWDIGDGVCCLEFTSKQNSIDLDIINIIEQSIDIIEKNYKALVIYNEGSNFSVGANIGLALFAANIGMWDTIAELVAKGQSVYQKLKHSSFPVVSAPSGMALGGGCEILLHSNAVQAHSESYVGLVEVGVGLIPAWGGCKEMLLRWLGDAGRFGGAMAAVGKVFEFIGTARVAKSALEAQSMKLLRQTDGITMNRDRLLFDAKQKALAMVDDYAAPQQQSLSLPGATARVAMSMAVKGLVKSGKATAYDEAISKKLAFILSGGDTDITDTESEDYILQLEREAFMELIKNEKTLARMEHILVKGKPLRN